MKNIRTLLLILCMGVFSSTCFSDSGGKQKVATFAQFNQEITAAPVVPEISVCLETVMNGTYLPNGRKDNVFVTCYQFYSAEIPVKIHLPNPSIAYCTNVDIGNMNFMTNNLNKQKCEIGRNDSGKPPKVFKG